MVLLLAAAAIQLAAYWPGIVYWDAVRQYGQALSGDFDDWHPPVMGWVWRRFASVWLGPAPMLLLQLGLYWAGFALLVARAGRSRLALAIALCALLPFSLATMGSVLKDCLMAGALLSAAGLLAWGRGRWLAVALLLFAATLRFNALFAALPLLVVALPPAWRAMRLRFAGCVIAATIVLGLAMPLANRAIGAKPSGVALSLVIFDLGGITEHSGVDAFPPLPIANPVAVNHACYAPVRWDRYAWWVDEPCPIQFAAIRDAFAARHESPYLFWLRAIAAHPLAYAEHRLAHTNVNLRFLVRDEIERPVQPQSAPNPWGYAISKNGFEPAIDAAAVWSAGTPLGWPICWLALALGALLLHAKGIAQALAISALLYGGTYLIFSVAPDLRYHLWTMIAAALAFVMAAASASPRRIALALLPALAVATLAASARLGLWG
ncbi:hypothetical protein [Sphingomonas immobilis]|uniref:Glycosyltransferase RgtA/B/C/D-like domain-containing protein n=1 Tax=Sphingomonas immobilis TaxID=3063997 RepID=A0ABT8ZZQ6_9SPHN|nr:hypothetical protein [Sphingomonas sp. CA1-15]MDO7843061.1 hypothetical protein [Sphingomonas sp. CA1-15]